MTSREGTADTVRASSYQAQLRRKKTDRQKPEGASFGRTGLLVIFGGIAVAILMMV